MKSSVKLLMIFILLFLSIGAVSASDDLNETICDEPQLLNSIDDSSQIISEDTGDLIETKVTVERSYDENGTISLNISLSDVDGKNIDDEISLTFDNDTQIISTVNGSAFVKYNCPIYGNGSITARYNGSSVYAPSSTTIDMIHPITKILIKDAKYDQYFYFYVYFSNATTGYVNLTLSSRLIYSQRIVDGVAIFKIYCINVGRFNAKLTYYGDNEYNKSTSKFSFRTYKGDIHYTVDNATKSRNYCTFDVNANKYFIGNIYVIYNGTVYESRGKYNMMYPGFDLSSCYYNFNIPELQLGENNITVIFKNDGFYNELIENTTIFVRQSVGYVDFYFDNEEYMAERNYGDVVNVTILADSGLTGSINFTVANQTFTYIMNKTSRIYLNLTDLLPGFYEITATYSGDDLYKPSSITRNLFINKLKPAADFNISVSDVIYNDDAIITVNVNDTGVIVLNINGENHTQEIKNGKAVFNITNLQPDAYEIEVTYPENITHIGLTKKALFYVNRYDPSKSNVTMNIDAEDIFCLEDAIIKVNINSNATGNIILTINNEEYVQTLQNGQTIFNVSNLNAGLQSFKVTYSGDDDFNSKILVSSLTVNKLTPNLEVVAYDVLEGEYILIYITTGGDGQISCDSINRNALSIFPLNNDLYIVRDRKLAAGEYNATVTFIENEIYNEVVKKVTYNVIAHNDSKTDINDSDIIITVHDNEYGKYPYIEFQLPENITGNITFSFKGMHTKALNKGYVSFNISDFLNAGNYSYSIRFMGDDTYNAFVKRFQLEMQKITPIMNISIDDITYGGIAKLYMDINVDYPYIDYVYIDLDGNVIEDTFYQGHLTRQLHLLECGVHNIKVMFNGSDNYNPISANTTFNVNKINQNMEIEVKDIDYGQTVLIKITTGQSPTGNLTVWINNESQVIHMNNTFYYTVKKQGLDAGQYNVNISYSGDSHYNPLNLSSKFNVGKINSTIKLTCYSITIGEVAQITVKPVEYGKGNITVKIANYTFIRDINDNLIFTIENLSAGQYNVTAIYSGDMNYNPYEVKSSFNVNKKNTGISITAHEITYGDTGKIILKFASDAKGNVTIKVSNQTLTQNLIDAKAQFNVTGLMPQNYTVKIYYSGDEQYNSLSTSTQFTVNKVNANLDLKIKNIKGIMGNIPYNEIAVAIININENATGNYTLKIGGYTFTGEIKNGLKINITGLNVGRHQANLTYSGDEIFREGIDIAYAKIVKTTPKIILNTSDTYYGSEAIVKVNINATGKVNLTIGNNTYTQNLTGGVATFNFTGLTVNNYEFNITYCGDENYNEATLKGSFKVLKANPTFTINVSDADYGQDVIVTVKSNATGNLKLTMDGYESKLNITNGEVRFNISKLDPNEYAFNITYSGDDNYNPAQLIDKFRVNKLNSTFTVEVRDADYGGNVTVKVNINQNGTVKLVMGSIVEEKEISNGFALFTLSNLDADDYIANITYSGNKYYNGYESQASFKVNKINSTFTVEVDNVNYGENVTFKVVINRTGSVKLVMGSFSDEKEITNGIVSFILSGLDADDYAANISYLGDGNHNPVNQSVDFKVYKLNSTFSVEVDNVNYGENVTVKVVINRTGSVRLVMGSFSDEKEISNGAVSFILSGLDADDYAANIAYLGDGNHNPVNQTVNFKVNKINSTFSVEVDNVNYGENVTFKVSINQNGRVKLVMGSFSDEKEISKCAVSFTLSGLDADDYAVDISYLGDKNHNPSNQTVNFKVYKVNSTFSVEVDNVSYGSNVAVKVNINQNGKVKLIMDNKSIEKEISNGIVLFTLSALNAGDYSANITYSGDNNHNPLNQTVHFKVNRLTPEIGMNVSNIVYGEHATVKVMIHAEGSVKLTVGNASYGCDIADGVATFTIPDLNAGSYDLTAIYDGNINYNGASINDSLRVMKADSRVIVSASDILKGQAAVISVKLNTNGNVKIYLNTTEYNIASTDNEAKLILSNLNTGKYNVKAIFAGDDNYNPSEYELLLEVYDKSAIMADDLIMSYLDGKIYSATVYGSDGKPAKDVEVIFKIGNNEYKLRSDKNGKVKLTIDLTPRTYSVTIYALGLNITKKLTVKQILTLKTVKIKKSAKKIVLKATLKKVNGKYLSKKKIKFKFNGKTYTGKTNKKGVAKVTINPKVLKKVKTGKQITYSATYVKNTVTKKSKVKK